MPVGFVHLLLF